MNNAMKAILANSKANHYARVSLFHSTPVLDRKRRNFWDSRHNYYYKRFQRLQAKENLFRNVNAFAEFMFQSCDEYDEDDPTSSRGTSWFKKQYSAKGSRRGRNGHMGSSYEYRRGFRACEEEDDEETIFHSAFEGNRFYYWSFTNEENSQWGSSSNYSGKSWSWRHRMYEDYEFSSEQESSELDLTSERLALGLNASGPLLLEDVKNAYRACALKWHPDRHQGSSKAVAEEKFKLCSAAYQSICDNIEVA